MNPFKGLGDAAVIKFHGPSLPEITQACGNMSSGVAAMFNAIMGIDQSFACASARTSEMQALPSMGGGQSKGWTMGG